MISTKGVLIVYEKLDDVFWMRSLGWGHYPDILTCGKVSVIHFKIQHPYVLFTASGQFANEFLWLDLYIGHRNSSRNCGHQGGTACDGSLPAEGSHLQLYGFRDYDVSQLPVHHTPPEMMSWFRFHLDRNNRLNLVGCCPHNHLRYKNISIWT